MQHVINLTATALALAALHGCGPSASEVATLRAELAKVRSDGAYCTTELRRVQDIAYAVSQEPCFRDCMAQRGAEIENETRTRRGLPPR